MTQFSPMCCNRLALGIVLYGWADEVFDHDRIVGALGVSPFNGG